MPKIDLQYSHGALHADALGSLTERLTTVLLGLRGVPDTPQSRANVWWFAQEQQAFVAGAAPAPPIVMVTFSLLGEVDAAVTEALVAEGTRAIKAVAPEARVWIVVDEVRDGNWGVEGALVHPAPARPAA